MSLNTLKKRDLGHHIGCYRKSKQAEWLTDNGIPFLLDAGGWPIASESVIADKLGEQPKTVAKLSAQPNFSALRA